MKNINTQKPVVLIFLHHYLPGYKSGGPVRTIANMVEHMGDEIDFYIVTSDRDALDTKPYESINIDTWNQVGKALVFYASPKLCTLIGFVRLIRDTPHDVLYLNSFFDQVFTMRPLLARVLRLIYITPVVLAPRGEFSQGAVTLKAWKKRPYLLLWRFFVKFSDITWQASSDIEVQDIELALGLNVHNIVVAPDLPPPVLLKICHEKKERQAKSPLRIVFISRISPMKNLDYALEVLCQVSIPVEFNIYGTSDDNAYWKKCQRIIEKLPPNIKVCYHGQIEHEIVLDVLSSQELFFLPTRGENYGHVIFEALAAGLPVLISDQTPWRDLADDGIGWDLSLSSKAAYVEAIEKQAKLTSLDRKAQSARSKAYATKIAVNKEIVNLNLRLFKDLLKDKC